MKEENLIGWKKMIKGHPWFNCDGCYPLPAYSEFMPAPKLGCKPYSKPDYRILSEDDPYGWKISEMEEEYELKPGIEHLGQQIMSNIIKLGKGLHQDLISGHGGENLRNNPFWPPELSAHAGSLSHERFVTLLPLMLSRTQDDKGRIIWTFFGNSIHDPEKTFWKSFFSAPGIEITEKVSISFFTDLISEAYGITLNGKSSLFDTGFRIMPTEGTQLPQWTKEFIINNNSSFENVKYLLTFKPFGILPESVKQKYLNGLLALLPFPGSLVFWGMEGYLKLKKELPVTGQIPLLNLVARNRGIGGLRVTQSGWLHEPHPGSVKHIVNENIIKDTFHRTHRWERVHRYQSELNEVGHKIKLIKALFSTEAEAMGLYNKPLASNSQIWNHKFELLLDGPSAKRNKIIDVEKVLANGGLFGYRFFYPPMRMGRHDIYLHRPLVAFTSSNTEFITIKAESLSGYLTAYNEEDKEMINPVELWPRMLKRELYLSALHDFNTHNDHYAHQTSFNIISLFESWETQNRKPLTRSLAYSLLNISKHKSLEQWLDELEIHAASHEKSVKMRNAIEKIIEPSEIELLPESLTYATTATRKFEENWWNDIKFLAHGEFVYKDNADIMKDEITLHQVHKRSRDIELVGDYFLKKISKDHS